MPANPHAYDDLAQVYAEEISPRHRCVLRVFRWCGGTLVLDRSANRRPSLAQIEYSQTIIIEHDPIELVNSSFDATRSKTQRKSSEAARRAGKRGGAATKALWARINATEGNRKAA